MPKMNVQINNEACVPPLSELVDLVVCHKFRHYDSPPLDVDQSRVVYHLYTSFFSVVSSFFRRRLPRRFPPIMHLCVSEVLLRSCIFTQPGYQMQVIFSENSN